MISKAQTDFYTIAILCDSYNIFFFFRCFVGQGTGPAQKPDENRYMELVIVKLCTLNPSPVKEKGKTLLRWTLIMRGYRKIREMILSNARIMRVTSIQLLEINNTTLEKWYNKRSKSQEQQLLEQGIHPPVPPIASTQSLPKSNILQKTSPSYPSNQFLFV